MQLDPDFAEGWYNLSVAHMALGQAAGAVNAACQALRTMPFSFTPQDYQPGSFLPAEALNKRSWPAVYSQAGWTLLRLAEQTLPPPTGPLPLPATPAITPPAPADGKLLPAACGSVAGSAPGVSGDLWTQATALFQYALQYVPDDPWALAGQAQVLQDAGQPAAGAWQAAIQARLAFGPTAYPLFARLYGPSAP